MRTLVITAALTVGTLAFAGRADAQYVIGTRGTTASSLGYYSPYPGALYSPFAAPPRVSSYGYSGFAQPRFISPFVTPSYGTTFVSPGYYGGGYGVNRYSSPGFYTGPRYGYRSYRRR